MRQSDTQDEPSAEHFDRPVPERACMIMPKNRTLKVVAGIAASLIGLVGTIIFLLGTKVISFEMALLMLVALLAMYLGFGILIAVYRLIGKLK
jgi:hypothetical protein